MKLLFILLVIGAFVLYSKAQNRYQIFPTYTGNDLGLKWSPTQSNFRIRAPTASKAQLKLYRHSLGGEALQTIALKKSLQGTWTDKLTRNHLGTYYTFCIEYKGQWLNEVTDPYAKAVGTNGKRAMIVDLKKTNPIGWKNDKSPLLKSATDAILYELHVRDASIAINSGIINKRKFIGFTETGTKNNEGFATGLDHLTELGITHIHLLPCNDYQSVDEEQQN